MLTEKQKISHRQAQKQYKLSDKGKICQTKYCHSQAKIESSARYQSKNLWKHKVHQLVFLAKKTGRLLKKPCQICGKPNAFAHHDDYSKPLDVKWFCNFHHCEYHKNGR